MTRTRDDSSNVPDSERLLRLIHDITQSETTRDEAIDRLFSMVEGFWGRGHLLAHAQAMAAEYARAFLRRYRISEDLIDAEGAANAAVAALILPRKTILRHPKAYLRGAIKNQVHDQVRRYWPEIKDRVTELPEIPAPFEKPEQEEGPDHWTGVFFMIGHELSPASAEIAYRWLVEKKRFDEIREELNLSAATLRKRIQRMHENIDEVLMKRIQ